MAGIALGMAEAVQNLGCVAEIGQNHVQHKEQIVWARRAFTLDSQSFRLDALDHAKEEIKSHYDTYAARIDTSLLVLALIFPFALNVIQFSDPFVPATADECEECVEVRNPWLVLLWGGLIGIVLVLPFWGILMLIRCKLKLDGWLEYSLAGLHRERREIVALSDPATTTTDRHEEQDGKDEQTEQMVFRLVNIVLEYQEYLARIWTNECGALVHSATVLLWLSAAAAMLLTSLSMWFWMVNKKGAHEEASVLFLVIIAVGCVCPLVHVGCQKVWGSPKPPVFDHDDMTDQAFPLSHAPSIRAIRPSSGAVSGDSFRLRAPASPAGSPHLMNGHSHGEPSVLGRFFCGRRRRPGMGEPLLAGRQANGFHRQTSPRSPRTG